MIKSSLLVLLVILIASCSEDQLSDEQTPSSPSNLSNYRDSSIWSLDSVGIGTDWKNGKPFTGSDSAKISQELDWTIPPDQGRGTKLVFDGAEMYNDSNTNIIHVWSYFSLNNQPPRYRKIIRWSSDSLFINDQYRGNGPQGHAVKLNSDTTQMVLQRWELVQFEPDRNVYILTNMIIHLSRNEGQ